MANEDTSDCMHTHTAHTCGIIQYCGRRGNMHTQPWPGVAMEGGRTDLLFILFWRKYFYFNFNFLTFMVNYIKCFILH